MRPAKAGETIDVNKQNGAAWVLRSLKIDADR
jgi:hypothetical protein